MASTIEKLEENIRKKIIISGYDAVSGNDTFLSNEDIATLKKVTICILIMKNGYVAIGECAPVDPVGFCPQAGRDIAYRRALERVYPLMVYELKQNQMENDDEKI